MVEWDMRFWQSNMGQPFASSKYMEASHFSKLRKNPSGSQRIPHV